ncbi:MAG: hypothetical protein ABFD69_05750 [Candidatus Sumerlaeia bacterium]
MNGRMTPSGGRRGAGLLFVIVMLPLAMMLMVLLLGNLQIRQFEMRRNEWRVQSRLLAESALALASTMAEDPDRPVSGSIEGAGRYRLERRTRPDGASVLVATGTAGQADYRVITEIEATRSGGRLTPQAARHWAESPETK